MSQNDRTRAEISSILSDLERTQKTLGWGSLAESDEIAEVWFIIERIEARVKALREAAHND